MDWITISGVQPWDGRYEFDLEGQELTTREWGWVKRLSGYMPLTIDQGFNGADPELFAAFAAIALYRAGRIQPADVPAVFERLQDAPFTASIQLDSDEPAEGDAGPPASSSNGSGSISGDGSRASSGSPDSTPPATGTPASATSESPPARSLT